MQPVKAATNAVSVEENDTAHAEAADSAVVASLVAGSKAGDTDAFGAIYDRFQPEIVRYLTYRMRTAEGAKDLAQQVFLKAWQAIPLYEDRGVPFKA